MSGPFATAREKRRSPSKVAFRKGGSWSCPQSARTQEFDDDTTACDGRLQGDQLLQLMFHESNQRINIT